MKGIGWEAMETHEHALLDRMLAGMRAMPWLTVYGEPVAEGRYGVVSFNVNDVHPHDVATILDAGGVAVRAGHHCAQPLMEFLGIGSCCRASVAIYNTPEDVDALLEVLAKEQPNIPRLSAAGEAEIARQKAEKAARRLPQLSKEAEQSVGQLKRASDYLAKKPELAKELSAAERRKRAQLQSKPVYRYVALAIFVFGIVSAAYGLYAVTNHVGNYGIYFALFGFAAIFLFSSYNMLPTARNNNNAIMKRADKAEAAMAEYVKHYPNGAFPVPSCYAHPIVLKQMTDAIEEGRAVTVPEALDAVEKRLQALNADVQVEQEEYDEVVVIKAMFLNHNYQ